MACQPLPALAVLPPQGAGAEACTTAVTPAALVMTMSAAATDVRRARIRTGLGPSATGGCGAARATGTGSSAVGPLRADAAGPHAGLADRLHLATQPVQLRLQGHALERLCLGKRGRERVEHLTVVLEQ